MKIDNTLYLDYQATTPVDPHVFEEMIPYFSEAFGNPHSSDHVFGWRASQTVEQCRKNVSALIGSDANEIIFTSGATESNNLALFGAVKGKPKGRRRILVSAIEHKCVLAAGQALAREEGVEFETIPVDKNGFVNLEALEKRLADDVLLVSVMWVNNEIGTVQDIAAIGKLVRNYGALFHCDAAQAPMAVDIDVLKCNVDLLSLSAHKLYGPKGIGALFVVQDIAEQIRPIIHGGDQQGGLRSGTVPTPLCVGFGAATKMLLSEDMAQERRRLAGLRTRLLEGLEGKGVDFRLNGPPADWRHPGNLNVSFKGVDAHALLGALQPRLCASTGAACTSGTIESSHVLGAIGLSDEIASSAVRFSVGRSSDAAQIDEAIELIAEAIDRAVPSIMSA